MTPTAVLVLVGGVLLVLAVAGGALVLDARRRRPRPGPTTRPAERIDSHRARQDPPTVRTPSGRHAEPPDRHPPPYAGAEDPTAPIERGSPADDRPSPRPRPDPRAPDT